MASMHLAVHYVGSDHSLTLIVEESPDDFVGRCTLTHYSDDRGWRVFTDDAGTVLRMRYDLVSPGIDCTPVGNENKEKLYLRHAATTKGFIAQGSEFGFGRESITPVTASSSRRTISENCAAPAPRSQSCAAITWNSTSSMPDGSTTARLR